MDWVLLVITVLVVSFGFVVFFGAPYLPTLDRQVVSALELVDLQPGQTLLELGCGDGRVLIAAAERGLTVVGYELNPLLALFAWLRTRRYGRQVRVIWGNFWRQEWPPAEGIFVFLLDKYMSRLDKKIAQYSRRNAKRSKNSRHPVKLVSFAFLIPRKLADDTRDGVYLYVYK